MTAHLRRAADLDWTLGELVERRAAEHGDRVLLRFGDGQTLSFAGLALRVAAVRTLLAARGLGPGDRVALMMRNSLRYPVAWLGVTSGGMAAVPVNSRSGPLDSRHLIDHSGARLVITDDTTAPTVHAAIAGIDRGVAVEDASQPDWSHPGLGRGAPPADVPAGTVAGVQYTSGTTGLPKGCMLSHRFWQQIGQSSADVLRLDGSSVLLSAQPFSYIDPLWNVVAALRSGAELVILDGFHPSTFMRSVADWGVTAFYCLAAMPVLLMKQPPAEHDRTHRLSRVACSAIPPRLHAAIEQRWGVAWYELFGMTETGLNLAVLEDDHDELVGTGSLGSVMSHCEAKVEGDAGGEAPSGTEGELVVRGLGLMDGYYENPEATAAFFAGGWAHTGDIAVRDARGRFTLRGRIKDMIRRGGENVAAAEVEGVLVSHPAVLECAVIAVPDDDLGEELRAVVVPVAGAAPSPRELREHVAQRLARFKVPRYWEFRSELPHTPSERVAKHRIGGPETDLIDLAGG
jgi:crotonobetaine/carnitine-CoA ligase